MEEKRKIYNENSEIKVDWSVFDEEFKTKEEQNFYYLNYINLLPKTKFETIKNNMYNSFKEGKINQINQSIIDLGKLISDLKLKRIESLDHLFNRSCKFKDYLKDKYKDELDDYNKKIVIVSHSCFGQIFTSKEIYGKSNIKEYPKDCCISCNCEAISVYI